MTPALLDRAVRYLHEGEGYVNWLYCDIVALPTTGVGFMIPSPVAMAEYGFIDRHTGDIATAVEKELEWKVIKKLGLEALARDPEKMPSAQWYRPYTTLDLPNAEIDRLLAEKLGQFDAGLAKLFDLNIPDDAHLGLLDMAYSMGITGLTSKYPRFCAAFRLRDWATCAAECARKNVSRDRNAALAGLFRSMLEAAVIKNFG